MVEGRCVAREIRFICVSIPHIFFENQCTFPEVVYLHSIRVLQNNRIRYDNVQRAEEEEDDETVYGLQWEIVSNTRKI